MRIGGRTIGAGQPCFIVAEAGVNHNGDADLALRLVDAAAAAGADAVKFQTFRADAVASVAAPKAAYQVETTGSDTSQLEMLEALELDEEVFVALKRRADERGIAFLSTPFDAESVGLLERLGVAAFKVASPDVTNLPLLREVGRRGRPVVLSTGASELDEAWTALRVLRAAGATDVVVLHCVSAYPAPPEQSNLFAIRTIAEQLGVPAGWSDHTTGSEAALAAVAVGASLLEKHLTIDRSLPGPDHAASFEPSELEQLVNAVRRVETMLGDGVKRVVEAERANATVARRSLAAAANLPAGTVLTLEMLTALRPGNGIPPTRVDDVVGRVLARDVAARQLLDASDLA